MMTCDKDYFFFVAHRGNTTYILNKDFTVDWFYVGNRNVYDDNVRPENLFDDTSILEDANSRKYEIEEFAGVGYEDREYYKKYEKRVVSFKFKPIRVNVKMSYFEDEIEDE